MDKTYIRYNLTGANKIVFFLFYDKIRRYFKFI